MKNASTQQSSINSRIKTQTTEAIKAKAAQASQVLKVPSDHVWWSFWLLQNSFKSIVRAYEIWLTNMNKYRLFRWLFAFISYITWPIQKILQLFAYIRFARMLYTVIVFIAGMIFTGDTAKSYYLAYTTIFSHTMDYILGISIASLHDLLDYCRNFTHGGTGLSTESLEQAISSKIELPIYEVKPDESSWWPSKGTLIVFGVAITTALAVWLWANYGSGAPSDPSSSTSHHTSVLDSIKNISSNAWHSSIDGVKSVWSNLADVYDNLDLIYILYLKKGNRNILKKYIIIFQI